MWTEGNDEEALSRGVYNTYTSHNLRYSQVSVIVLFTCSGNSCCWMITNLPVQEQINSLLNFTAPPPRLPSELPGYFLSYGDYATFIKQEFGQRSGPGSLEDVYEA